MHGSDARTCCCIRWSCIADIRAYHHTCARRCLRSVVGRVDERVSYCRVSISPGFDPGAGEVGSRSSKLASVVSWIYKNAEIEKSYCYGVTAILSRIAICVDIAIIVPQLCLGMAVFWSQTYVPQAWPAFSVYQAANVLVLVYNIYLLRWAMWMHDLACKCLFMRQLPPR